MVDAAENRLLTESGPGTRGGELLRRYWQPAALVEELKADRPLAAVTLLGEELVLFRNELGDLGLVGRRCPHRGVDLTYGRLEDGGLRCPFHGWLFDPDGRCLETPAEPADSTFCERVQHTGYPVKERNGIIWAWMGGGEPPALPGLDCMVAPSPQVFAFKGMWECNWLQAHEVGIDPSHASFLHRFLEDEEDQYGLQFRSSLTGIPATKLLREVANPEINMEPTSYGFRLVTLRDFRGEFTHVRVTNNIFPNAITIPMSNDMVITQWHVPIDDHTCYWYSMFLSYTDPVDADAMREQRIDAVELPLYRPLKGRAHNWGFDPAEQLTETYTGMGPDINVHDQWAVESPGPVHDRTQEQLSPADIGIRTQRRLLFAALDDSAELPKVGGENLATVTGPAAIDAVDTHDDPESCWRALEHARRQSAAWAPQLTD